MTQPQEPTVGGSAETSAPGPEPIDPHAEEITGVDNWIEEGGKLEPSDVAEVEDTGTDDDLAEVRRQLDERTADLQRLQAEYVNYKRRVDRDREQVLQNATYAALAPIVEVLDTIDRAREHGDLDEGLKAVADQLERTVAGRGLVKFGEVGEPFDPTLHEALAHQGESADVEVTTIAVVATSGYKIGDRVVRAAQVLVVDPAAG